MVLLNLNKSFILLEILVQILSTLTSHVDDTSVIKEKDCIVYQAYLQRFTRIHSINNDIQVGFFRPDTIQPPEGVHIFFYQDEIKVTEIFINKSILSGFEQNEYKTSNRPLMLADSLPSWYFFTIRMNQMEANHDLKLNLLRPGDIIPLLSWTVKHQLTSKYFTFEINSGIRPSYVVFNCLTGCPIFRPHSTKGSNISISLQYPLTLHLWVHINKTLVNGPKFEYVIEADNDGRTHSKTITNATILHIRNEKLDNGSTCVKFEEFSHCGNISLRIVKNNLFSWTLECKHTSKKGGSGHRDGRTLATNSRKPKAKERLTLGQVIAWIVSAIALCGVIILAMMLYYNIKGANGKGNHLDGNIANPSIMMSDYEVYPDTSKHSYRVNKQRIPEEAIQPRESYIDTSTFANFEPLYPLKVLSDDETSVEEGFSINSIETVSTIVHKDPHEKA